MAVIATARSDRSDQWERGDGEGASAVANQPPPGP
jgi:hypothetical protein